jgi:hypothetical protein
VAVAIVGATAYSTGIGLKLAIRRRPRDWSYLDPGDLEMSLIADPFAAFGLHRGFRPGGELPAEVLRFGVQFSDGRKATTLGRAFRGIERGEPSDPILMQGGGGGSDGNWESEFWLWPVPPPGRVTFVVEWPSEKIEETSHEVDAALFRDAVAKSEVLWPETGGSGLGGSSSHIRLSGSRQDTEDDEPPPDRPAGTRPE